MGDINNKASGIMLQIEYITVFWWSRSYAMSRHKVTHSRSKTFSVLATISQSGWLFPCHHHSNRLTISLPPSLKQVDYFLATITQTGWPFPCHHHANRLTISLPPSLKQVNHFLATISLTCLTISALPWSLKHGYGWLFPCHLQSNMLDYCLALPPTVKHGWLLPCHHQPNMADYYLLPPSVQHSWLLPCLATNSQTPLTVPLPLSVKHGWLLPYATFSPTCLIKLPWLATNNFLLPPIKHVDYFALSPSVQKSNSDDCFLAPNSQTRLPFAHSVLVLRPGDPHSYQKRLVATVYATQFCWMKIAVCKQISLPSYLR